MKKKAYKKKQDSISELLNAVKEVKRAGSRSHTQGGIKFSKLQLSSKNSNLSKGSRARIEELPKVPKRKQRQSSFFKTP